MLVKVDRKDTKTVVDALIRTAHQLPNELYKSLTWDRGKEMADHRRFTLATDIQVYFCDPQGRNSLDALAPQPLLLLTRNLGVVTHSSCNRL